MFRISTYYRTAEPREPHVVGLLLRNTCRRRKIQLWVPVIAFEARCDHLMVSETSPSEVGLAAFNVGEACGPRDRERE